MSIAAVCITHNRPGLLSQAVRMFQLQSCPDKEMLIFDDCGQYESGRIAENIRVVSIRQVFASLGTVRNLAVRMTDADHVAIWDDDDVYFPWHLDACAHALASSDWAGPSVVWDQWKPDELILSKTTSRTNPQDICYHGSWCYRRAAFEKVRGYPDTAVGDSDCEFARRLFAHYGPPGDTVSDLFPDPSYLYSRDRSKTWHASEVADDAMLGIRNAEAPYVGRLVPARPEAYMRGLPIHANVEARRW